MILSQDILSIVLLYIRSHKLLTFMIQHHITIQSLKYDASHDIMSPSLINALYINAISYNPNFILIGVRISINRWNELMIPMHNIKHIVLIEETPYYAIMRWDNMMFDKCQQIKRLKFININIPSLDALYGHTNVQSINFLYCKFENGCTFTLSSCPNIKSIRLTRCTFHNCIPQITSYKLRHFYYECIGIGSCAKIFNNFMLENCTNLRHIKIRCTCAFNNFPLTDIIQIQPHKIPNLRSIDLSDCYSLKCVNALCDHPNLRFINLSRCCSLQNIYPLYNHPNLRRLNISNCNKICKTQILNSKLVVSR